MFDMRQENEERENISEEGDGRVFLITLSQERCSVLSALGHECLHIISLEQQTILRLYPVHLEEFLNIYQFLNLMC